MGYLKANSTEVDKLDLPTDPEFHVFMKKRGSYGDRMAVQASAVKVSMAGTEVTPSVDSAASVRMGIVRLVTGWNLTDEEDQPLPVTLENIDKLDPEDGEFLAREAQKRLEVRATDQQVPSSNGSGRTSTATRSKTK